MSQHTPPKRTIELFSTYRDKGHQGEIEIETDYTIEASGSSRTDQVVLVIDSRRTRFPSGDELGRDVQRFAITASDLVEFIQKHGTRIP
ncbi:hypothetical protein [Sorangium sp. So ce1389]|uniref:hypothetical protein n=1 Tax=Sorangium sp. So ce1389 TaxID=3133336 RepID=UPI003F5D7BCE